MMDEHVISDTLSRHAHQAARNRGHGQLAAYSYAFRALTEEDLKSSISFAVRCALEARDNREVDTGLLTVILNDTGLGGYVVDVTSEVSLRPLEVQKRTEELPADAAPEFSYTDKATGQQVSQ